MAKIYSYVVEHDYGLAPNPFGGYCTLAVCKPKIRKSSNLEIGDWIIGTGSKSLERFTKGIYLKKLIYAMRVEEKISFNEYWRDERFQYKKPVLNGSLAKIYGDNIYYADENGVFFQVDSAHSNADGSTNEKHLKTDTNGQKVIISQDFYYFGELAPKIPQSLLEVCHSGIGEKIVPARYTDSFLKWLKSNFDKGIHGDPANWISYKQLPLF